MRELTIAECDIVAGGNHSHNAECGYGSSCDWVDDVIVDHPGGGGDGGGYGPPSGPGWDPPGPGGSTPGTPPPEMTDELCRSVDSSNLPNPTGSESDAVEKLKDLSIPTATVVLNDVPGGTVFHMPDGSDVTIEHLRDLWAKADFEVYDAPTWPNNGGVGEADANGGDPVFRIVASELAGYMYPGGYIYYPLHELAHVTNAGQAANAAYHNGQITWAQNEAYSNALAIAIAQAAGHPLPQTYINNLTTPVATGVTTTMGNGPKGEIDPISPCN
ncbi:hypothetical protein LTR94_026776 [Friedmanniomyces endolithicus]|nr:hypothetical protein LTR94_026776 [Friedmanniomyces endolithicus]